MYDRDRQCSIHESVSSLTGRRGLPAVTQVDKVLDWSECRERRSPAPSLFQPSFDKWVFLHGRLNSSVVTCATPFAQMFLSPPPQWHRYTSLWGRQLYSQFSATFHCYHTNVGLFFKASPSLLHYLSISYFHHPSFVSSSVILRSLLFSAPLPGNRGRDTVTL